MPRLKQVRTAVYFGLHHFTARAKVGFDLTKLPDVMKALHSSAVKGFVTFNTLVFDHELLEAERAITKIAEAGADAIIVQDIAMAKLARQITPDLEVHGSTQMSITSAQGAELAKTLGCSRVVLGRELSLLDIERIAKTTDVELETFVHGALCVSYSGQCFINFRLEFVHESPEQVCQVITAFQKTLAGEKSFDALQKELSKISPSGTTEGSLFVPEDFSHLPQLL
jgi:collagenase-like PrtC family protease